MAVDAPEIHRIFPFRLLVLQPVYTLLFPSCLSLFLSHRLSLFSSWRPPKGQFIVRRCPARQHLPRHAASCCFRQRASSKAVRLEPDNTPTWSSAALCSCMRLEFDVCNFYDNGLTPRPPSTAPTLQGLQRQVTSK